VPDVGVGVTDQPDGAGVVPVRARSRSISGTTYAEQYVIPIPERVPSFKGMAATFRTLGNAASPQNLFSIENQAGSSVLVALRRLSVQMDSVAALAAVATQFKTSRPSALPTNGTPLTKVAFDSALSSASAVVLRGATASDGGAATAITATAGSAGWHQFAMRLHTLVGQVLVDDEALIPLLTADDPIYLRPGESLLTQIVQATAANNKNTDHYVVNCMWEEFTLP
jgi:hypothetical protein